MEQFNNNIVIKLAEYISKLMESVSYRDNLGRTIKLVKYDAIPIDNFDISYLQANGLTAKRNVLFYFDILNENKRSMLDSLIVKELEIPVLVDGSFYIEGKVRTAIQTLTGDLSCRISENRITIDRYLTIDKIDNEILINFVDDNDEMVSIHEVDLAKIIESNDPIKSVFELTDKQILKLQIKLDKVIDTRYLTPELIRELFKCDPDDRSDNIIDKIITTVESELMSKLWSWNKRKGILINISNKFFQYDNIYLTDIQTEINKYFRLASDDDISIPETTNPLSYDSLSYRLVMPKYVAYNESMTDLIDPIYTPENNNVNRLNYLNVCTVIKGEDIYIKCKNTKGDGLELLYLEYLNTPVLISEHFDYELGKIIPSDVYEIKLRQKRIKVTDLSQFPDLVVEPAPDDRLSVTTRRIPLINSSDSIRVAMGSKMSEQAIEIEESEPAMISSGNDDVDFRKASRVVRYHGNGAKVEKIVGNKIVYRDNETGSINFYEIPQPTLGQTGAVISYIGNVQPGSKLTEGSEVIVPKIMQSGNYELGTNANCFYMNYLGYTHEDGIVISKSFANKLTSYSIEEVSIHVSGNHIVEELLPIGTKIKSLDTLVKCSKAFGYHDKIQSVYLEGDLMSALGLTKISDNLKVPNNIEIGYVVNVKIQENPYVSISQEVTKEVIEKFLANPSTSNDWNSIPDRYKNLGIADKEFYSKDAYIITYKLIKVRPAIIGSKLCNRYGSKGEVSLILPDELMPKLERDGNWVTADILLNPPAIIARKNPSQLFEALMTKLIYKVIEGTKSIAATGNLKAAKEYTKPLYGTEFTSMDDDEFLEALNDTRHSFVLNVGSFSKLDINKLKELSKDFNVPETESIYCPDVVIGEGENGITAVSPDDSSSISKLRDSKYFELGWLESDVITGYTYFMKLFHSSDYVGKITATNSKSKEPILGKGTYREEGQKIGEMELWSLLAYGTEKFVMDQDESKLASQYEFINNLLLAGYTIVDSNELPLMSDYKTNMQKLKDHFNNK